MAVVAAEIAEPAAAGRGSITIGSGLPSGDWLCRPICASSDCERLLERRVDAISSVIVNVWFEPRPWSSSVLLGVCLDAAQLSAPVALEHARPSRESCAAFQG